MIIIEKYWTVYAKITKMIQMITINSKLFKFQAKVTGRTPNNDNTKDVEIAVLWKCISNFWQTLQMPLIILIIFDYTNYLILTWSLNCVISAVTRITTLAITDTKFCIPIVTLSNEDNSSQLNYANYYVNQRQNFVKKVTEINIKRNNWSSEPILRLLSWSKFSKNE